jgi:hypothetical protein
VSFGVDPLPLFVVQRVPMGYQLLTVTANGNDPAGPRVFSGSDNRNAECDQRSVTKMPGLYRLTSFAWMSVTKRFSKCGRRCPRL